MNSFSFVLCEKKVFPCENKNHQKKIYSYENKKDLNGPSMKDHISKKYDFLFLNETNLDSSQSTTVCLKDVSIISNKTNTLFAFGWNGFGQLVYIY